jgi:hypothetical protein
MTNAETWHREQHALWVQARDEKLARQREWTKSTERRLRAKREAAAQKAAAQPKAPPPPATSGIGWEVLEVPRVSSHEQLEAHARNIWGFVWHGIDWPAGWRVRWGALDGDLLAIGAAIGKALGGRQCAASLFGNTVLGLAVMHEKLILLDEEQQQRRTPRQFAETLIHELIHANVHGTAHGEQFQAALRSALAYYDGASVAPMSAKGVRFRPNMLDPTLEYRG